MRLFAQRKQERVDRRLALSGIPVLNAGVAVESLDNGGARVSMTVRRGRGFFERLRPVEMTRSYELDEFGRFVLEMVDGERSVLDVVDAFEKRFPMSRREVELAVVAFFKMLMQRNVLAVAVAKHQSGAAKAVVAVLVVSSLAMGSQSARARETAAPAASPAAAAAGIHALARIGGVNFPGSDGNLRLEKHVADTFKAAAARFEERGFETGDIVFKAPVFEPGTLTLDCGEYGRFTLDAMHPTLMRPGNFKRREFNTRLVYLGHGGVEGLKLAEGISLDGAVAVMEYDSGDAWLDVLRFGVAGVVFVGSDSYSHNQAVSKVFNSEVSIPRFFIDGERGGTLRAVCRRNREIAAQAFAKPSRWSSGGLRDVWLMIPGTDETLAERVIVFTAALDANSVVPARATGAQRLINLHLLLTLLEDFQQNPPRHSVMLVAVNGHTQRYAGERMLAWHLLAEEARVEGHRDRIAGEMRTARLFKTEYEKLKLQPVAEDDKQDLHILMEILRVLDRWQQAAREKEHKKALDAGIEELAKNQSAGDDTAPLAEDGRRGHGDLAEVTLSLPVLDKVLDLDAFDEAALRDAVKQAEKDVLDGYDAFFAKRGRDPKELAAEKEEDMRLFQTLKSMPYEPLINKVNRVKHVFDDEKLFEEWRSKLDESTGRRIYVKSQLQDHFKGEVNKTTMEIMATAARENTAFSDEEKRAAELTRLQNLRDTLRQILVLFNKLDIGVGRSRTYYRQIAVNDELRVTLLAATNKFVSKFSAWMDDHEEALRADAGNGRIREVLGSRQVALVTALELDPYGDRAGFSWQALETTGDGFRDFGSALVDIARSIETADAPFRYVDTVSAATDKPPAYFFSLPESAVFYYQGAQSTPAVALKSAFCDAGALFGPADTVDKLDAERIHAIHDWTRRFIAGIVNHESVVSSSVLKPVVRTRKNIKYFSWSTLVRTFGMEEFTGKPIPTKEIPGSIVTIYDQNWSTFGPGAIVGGDVVNTLMGITDDTGTVSFHGLAERHRLAPLAYQMDTGFTDIFYALDKGRVQSSKQINSNMQRTVQSTLPMFECREFVIYDRQDPSLISAAGIDVGKYWPKVAEGQSDPVKYGVHGAACLSPALSHTAWGPVGIYLEQPRVGAKAKSLMVITDQKRCVLGAEDEHPQGVGFSNQEDLGPDFFQNAAEDMAVLNRWRNSEMKGVVNQLLDEFQSRGEQFNATARESQEKNDHLAYLRNNYEGLGNGVKAYAEIQKMNKDMLQSIVVYMALMIPFCFFLQKLLFAFKKMEHELAGFAVMFVTMFVVFRLIHPAFRLAMNPEAIFIAFVLGAIGCFTTGVLRARFHGEMLILLRGIGGIGEQARYGTVGQTATIIGVQNMRRRRVRTSLTCATIVLVVFTMLAFSSVSRKAKPTLISKSEGAPYTGFFYHWPAGLPMDEGSCRVIKTLMSGKADVRVRRAMTRESGWLMERLGETDRHIDITAISGLPANDMALRDSLALVSGRMFSSDAAEEVLLTVSAAEALGVDDAEVGTVKVRLMGRELTVRGLLNDQRYRVARDLNPNLPLIPLGPAPRQRDNAPKEEGTLEMRAVDIEARMLDTATLAIVPVDLAKEFGAQPCAVSIIFPGGLAEDELGDEIRSLLDVTQARFYVGSKSPFKLTRESASPVKSGVYYVGSSYRTAIGGLAKLIIPLIIAGSIILNTMLGTVYERKSEIAVYNAIGLNPTHIFMFFLAEALVYSFLGAVGGYLIGQVLTVGIKSLGWVEGLNINFSSLIVVYAILFTMLLVLLSTIYPGLVATRIAVPSGKRKWSMPPNDGDTMHVVFPFIYRPRLAYGVMQYLHSFFEPLSEQSSGDIIAQFDGAAESRDGQGRFVLTLKYHIALAPYDLGVTQHVVFKATYDDVVKSYRLHMDVIRDTGRDTNWVTTNKPFLERMRKYLIRWRNIDPTRHNWYVSHAGELFQSDLKNLPADGLPE
ncbi:MAG: PqqD family peptide modification chaperone [Lentisphaeria bacterium]|nr:PqqD family peptide modification chaperone [Lentisphaeria bacterium]